MTIKLYDTNPYDKEFKASIISCTKINDVYDIVLNQTLFFPEEGGQSCDQGFLNDIEVIDVQIKDGIIHHYTKKEIKGNVFGKIDWNHRYSNMQNHSGEHVLSGLVHSLYGFNNVGFHLGKDEITTDYDGFLSNEQLIELETRANQVIFDNKEIRCYYPDYPEKLEYRSKKEIKEAIRIVEIENVDVCACCAPHVRSTSEIGLIKILKAMKHRKGIRIYFACGKKAFENYQMVYRQATQISNLLSSPIENIALNVNRVNDDIYSLRQEITQLKKQSIDSQTKNLEMKDHYIIFEENIDMNTQKYYLNQLKPYCKDYAAIFVKQESNYRFLLVSNVDAREQLKQLKEHFVVRGGGKQDNIQGTIEATKEEILKILK